MKHLITTAMLLSLRLVIFGQAHPDESNENPASIYWNISAGGQFSKFRDFATSPLFYEGAGTSFGLSRLQIRHQTESEFSINVSKGTFTSKVGKEEAASSVSRIEAGFSLLKTLPSLSQGGWQVKAGGYVNALVNIRQNPALLNNAVGFEMINTLFASAKVSRDISRKESKEKRMLFLKYRLKPKQRNLSYRLNIGLVNNTFRNGYSYVNDSWVLNEEEDLLDNHTYKVFKGMRLGGELNYTRHLPNGNAIQWSLVSDLYNTGGDSEQFEFAYHALRFTLMFNTKN